MKCKLPHINLAKWHLLFLGTLLDCFLRHHPWLVCSPVLDLLAVPSFKWVVQLGHPATYFNQANQQVEDWYMEQTNSNLDLYNALNAYVSRQVTNSPNQAGVFVTSHHNIPSTWSHMWVKLVGMHGGPPKMVSAYQSLRPPPENSLWLYFRIRKNVHDVWEYTCCRPVRLLNHEPNPPSYAKHAQHWHSSCKYVTCYNKRIVWASKWLTNTSLMLGSCHEAEWVAG